MTGITWPRFPSYLARACEGRTIQAVEGLVPGAPATVTLHFTDGAHLSLGPPAEGDDQAEVGFADPGASTRLRVPEVNQELAKRDQLARAHQAAQALTDQIAVALVQQAEMRERAEKAEALLRKVADRAAHEASMYQQDDGHSGDCVAEDFHDLAALARGEGA